MIYIFTLTAVFAPVAGACALTLLKFKTDKARNIYVLCTLLLTAAMSVFAAVTSKAPFTLWQVSASLSVAFNADALGGYFSVLASLIWIAVGIYSFGYMKHEHCEKRFYIFFILTLGVINGICYSANLFTMYIFYEGMTLATFPLVMHAQTKEAISAGKKYLMYSFIGASLALIGIFCFYAYSSSGSFSPGGILNIVSSSDKKMMLGIYFITILGFGCKAGMFPLHSWLTSAHPIAPSPASAVLSGVITKMGVLAVIRTTFYVAGGDFIRGTWVQTALIILAMISILLGSVIAFRTKLLKKRLAYSSISQVSYILLGIFLLNETAFTGAMLHVVFHSIIKNILFMCAGAVIVQTGKKYADELIGIGKEMRRTMICFAVASLALVGIPPLAGFISKGYIALGAFSYPISSLGYTASALLMVSALFTAGYLFPICVKGFFPGDDYEYRHLKKKEAPPLMRRPIIALTLVSVAAALFPGFLMNIIAAVASSLF